MKRILFIIVLFGMCTSAAQAQLKGGRLVDVPTAYTLIRGAYQFDFLGYDNGGIELKTIIGLHERILLGVSWNVQRLIGNEKPVPEIPGVVAKIKLFNGWDVFPINWSVGYDSFYIGKKTSKYDTIDRDKSLLFPPYYVYHYLRKRFSNREPDHAMNYGPYMVFTSPIYIFNFEWHFIYGARMLVQPEVLVDETAYFVGLDLPLGEYIRFKAELVRVYWDFRNPDDWVYNFGLRYTYLDKLSIEFDILYEPGERINRILKIEYRSEF